MSEKTNVCLVAESLIRIYGLGQKYTHSMPPKFSLCHVALVILHNVSTAHICKSYICESKMSYGEIFLCFLYSEPLRASFLAHDCSYLFACELISFQLFRPAEGRFWATAAKRESHSWPQWRKLHWLARPTLHAHIHTLTHTSSHSPIPTFPRGN